MNVIWHENECIETDVWKVTGNVFPCPVDYFCEALVFEEWRSVMAADGEKICARGGIVMVCPTRCAELRGAGVVRGQ
jgi:hypothetical protein